MKAGILILLFIIVSIYSFSQTHKEDDVYYDSTTEAYISIFPSGKANILIGTEHPGKFPVFKAPYLFGTYYFRKDTLTIIDNDSIVKLTFLKKNKSLIPIHALALSPKSIFIYKYTNETFDEDFGIELGKNYNKIDYSAKFMFEKNKEKMDSNYNGVYIPSDLYGKNMDSTGESIKLILDKNKYEIYFMQRLWLKGKIIKVDQEEMVFENPYGMKNFVYARHDNNIITASVFFKYAKTYTLHRITVRK